MAEELKARRKVIGDEPAVERRCIRFFNLSFVSSSAAIHMINGKELWSGFITTITFVSEMMNDHFPK